MQKGPLAIAVALLVAGTVAFVILIGGSGSSKQSHPVSNQPVATLLCLGGSEKQELMADPRFRAFCSTAITCA